MLHFSASRVPFTRLAVALPSLLLAACSGEGEGPAIAGGGANHLSTGVPGAVPGAAGTGVMGTPGGGGAGTSEGGGTPSGVASGGSGAGAVAGVAPGGAGMSATGGGAGPVDGMGGAPPMPLSICTVSDPNSVSGVVIDDMEGAVGWFSSNDDQTQQSPSGSFAPGAGLEGPGAQGSALALHSTVTVPDNAEWGATIQLDLGAATNASEWEGVKLWARGSGDVRLNLVTAGTLPPDAGGTCSGECYDSHGTRLSLRDTWTEVKIRFSDVRQEGFGTAVDFDAGTLQAIALQIKNPGSYDIWLDDVEFFTEQGMPDCVAYPGDSRCEATESYCGECPDDPRCECVLATCIETGVLEGPLACDQGVLNTRQGGSTRYWISQASSDRDTSGGYEALGCGAPVISKGNDQGSAASQDKVAGAPGDGTMFGALNSSDFGEDARLCGACVLINDNVKIQIVDECPNRPGAQSNPACNSGHIDLSIAAANQVGGDNPGISWRIVPCDNSAPEYYWHWDTTTFWGALSVVGLKYPAAKVELKDGDSWLQGQRKSYWGAWIFGRDDEIPGSSGSVPPPPWTVRITDIHGQVMQDRFTSDDGGYPNRVDNGRAVPYPSQGMIQLPECGGM